MQFRLYYRGKLTANGGPLEKHNLRRHFHSQLKRLWGQMPLKTQRRLLRKDNPPGNTSLVVAKNGFEFIPLVSSRIYTVASLEILFIRPEPPGSIVSRGGDLDNRLKTLLDALKVPHEPTAMPRGITHSPDEMPLHCLLEDDNLVTHFSVTTDRLLDVDETSNDVVVVIKVETQPIVVTLENLSL